MLKWAKNGPKMSEKKTLYATMFLDKNEKMCKNHWEFT